MTTTDVEGVDMPRKDTEELVDLADRAAEQAIRRAGELEKALARETARADRAETELQMLRSRADVLRSQVGTILTQPARDDRKWIQGVLLAAVQRYDGM